MVTIDDFLKMSEDEQFDFLAENSWNGIEPSFLSDEEKEEMIIEVIDDSMYYEQGKKALETVIKRHTHNGYLYVENWYHFDCEFVSEYDRLIDN